MNEFLLELYSEEVPASMVWKASEDFANLFANKLSAYGLDNLEVKNFFTPRRIAIVISNIPSSLRLESEEIKGPKIGSPQFSIQKFAEKYECSVDELELKDTDKGKFYFYYSKAKDIDVKLLLSQIIHNIISEYKWPKSMRWGSHKLRWVRPLRNIMALFNSEIIDLEFEHLKANNKTFGHLILSPKEITVSSFTDYVEKLKSNYVILDHKERLNIIESKLKEVTDKYEAAQVTDYKLMEENCALCEFPGLLVGSIDANFLTLPKELLQTSMKLNQRYFTLVSKHDGKMLPYFAFVTNSNSSKNENIILGNEKVIRARFKDAEFLVETDLKNNLEYYSSKLKDILFFNNLGSIHDKAMRMKKLAILIAKDFPQVKKESLERACLLSKADLASNLVDEFPNLQGVIGSYYAQIQSEDMDIVNAIAEHYLPLSAEGEVPKTEIAIILALADRIDSLSSLFAIGEKPTGSKDPFALRRAAISISRILIENNVSINLRPLISKIIHILHDNAVKLKGSLDSIENEIIDFIRERLMSLFKSKDYDMALINAVLLCDSDLNPALIKLKLESLKNFAELRPINNLVEAHKRIKNIISKSFSNQKEYEVKQDLFESDFEKELWQKYSDISKNSETALSELKFENYLENLLDLSYNITNLFDNVMINAENIKVKENRINMLKNISVLFERMADFSVL